MLRRGISYAQLSKLYSPEIIMQDFSEMMNSSFGVITYCKQAPVFNNNKLVRSWPTYILTVDDLPELFKRYPETMINIVLISYSDM